MKRLITLPAIFCTQAIIGVALVSIVVWERLTDRKHGEYKPYKENRWHL